MKFNDRKNLFEARIVKYFSRKIRNIYVRLNDFTLDSREGRRRLSGMSRAKYLVPVRKLQEEGGYFEKLGQISKLDEKVFACNWSTYSLLSILSRREHNAARVATNILPGLNTRQGNVAQKLSRIDMAGNARDLSNIWKSTVGSSLSFHRVKAKYLRNRLWTYASKICVNLFMWICERGRGREKKEFEFVTNRSMFTYRNLYLGLLLLFHDSTKRFFFWKIRRW